LRKHVSSLQEDTKGDYMFLKKNTGLKLALITALYDMIIVSLTLKKYSVL